MISEVLVEDDLIRQQSSHGVAFDGSLEMLLDGAPTIREVLFQLSYYEELLAELMVKGWELADPVEGTYLFLRNPRHPMPECSVIPITRS